MHRVETNILHRLDPILFGVFNSVVVLTFFLLLMLALENRSGFLRCRHPPSFRQYSICRLSDGQCEFVL